MSEKGASTVVGGEGRVDAAAETPLMKNRRRTASERRSDGEKGRGRRGV